MTEGYEVLKSTERLRNRVFAIVTDELRMPDGSVAERDYMRHVGSVGVVALDDADRVVLVRQYRHPLGGTIWELPAGLIDVPGEPLVDAAALAELRKLVWPVYYLDFEAVAPALPWFENDAPYLMYVWLADRRTCCFAYLTASRPSRRLSSSTPMLFL